MTSLPRLLLGVLALVGPLTVPGHAVEMNQRQGLGPAEQVKVGNVLAQSYRMSTTTQTAPGTSSTGCGATKIGTITGTSSPGRTENIVAVRGDIITVNRNTRCP
jgi:hypothetical protein